jgi:hypothetical protein
VSAKTSRLVRELRREGWQVELSRNGHLKIRDERGRIAAVTGSTASDWRAVKNLRADLARHRRQAATLAAA